MPKIVNKEKKKKEIALAALDVFSENGFEKASMNQIAKHIGVAKGSLYDYFKTKDELIFESIRVMFKSMMSESFNVFDNIEDPEEKLRAMLNYMVDLVLDNSQYIKLSFAFYQVILSEKYSWEQRKEAYDELIIGVQSMLIDVLVEGVEKGIFLEEVKNNADKIALNMMASFDGIALYYHINRDPDSMREQVNIYLDYLLEKNIKK